MDTATQTSTDTSDYPSEPSGDYVSPAVSSATSTNWIEVADTTSDAFVGLTMDGAWAIDDRQQVFPLWAEPSTEDGRVYEITLRDNLQWGAGYGQMTADDWIYTIQEVFQAEENWAGFPNPGDWTYTDDQGNTQNIPVEKTGKLSFEVRLNSVDPVWPNRPIMWGQYCMPQELLEQYRPDNDLEGLRQDPEVQQLQYSGNLGPYNFEEWQRDSQFTVTRNDDYYLADVEDLGAKWENAPYFNSFTIQIITEESSRLSALRNGEIDDSRVAGGGIPPSEAQSFIDNADTDVYVQPAAFTVPMVFNMRANGWTPFRNIKVRQAFSCAVGANTLADQLYRGYAEPAYTMQPTFSKWYPPEEDIADYTFGTGDLVGQEPARSRMEEGLADTDYGYDGDTLLNPDGEEVTLTIYASSSGQTNQTLGELIMQGVEQNLGINMEMETITGSTFQEQYAINSPGEGEQGWESGGGIFNGGPRDVSTSAKAWDMSINLGLNTYPMTPSSSAGFFKEKGGINYYGYVPESNIPELFDQASTTVDEDERASIFAELFAKIAREQPFGFLVLPSDIYAARSNVVGPSELFTSGWDSQAYYFE